MKIVKIDERISQLPAFGENGKIFQLPQLIWKNLEVEFAASGAAA